MFTGYVNNDIFFHFFIDFYAIVWQVIVELLKETQQTINLKSHDKMLYIFYFYQSAFWSLLYKAVKKGRYPTG